MEPPERATNRTQEDESSPLTPTKPAAVKNILFAGVLLLILTSFSPKALTWVAIGDSITYLNEHQNETGNRVTKGYMTRVTERLPYIHYINQGHNGWTSGGIAQNIE